MLKNIHHQAQATSTPCGTDQGSPYRDQQCLPGTQTEEEEGVDHSRYLAGHREQQSPEQESHGHQIRETEREIEKQTSVTIEAEV